MTLIKVILKNPPTLLIGGGLLFIASGAWYGWLLVIAGIGLNLAWL